MEGMYTQRGRAVILNESGIDYLNRIRDKQPPSKVNEDTLRGLRGMVDTLRRQHEDDAAEIRRLQDLINERDKSISVRDEQIR